MGTVHISDELNERLEVEALRTGKTKIEIVTEALSSYMKKLEYPAQKNGLLMDHGQPKNEMKTDTEE